MRYTSVRLSCLNGNGRARGSRLQAHTATIIVQVQVYSYTAADAPMHPRWRDPDPRIVVGSSRLAYFRDPCGACTTIIATAAAQISMTTSTKNLYFISYSTLSPPRMCHPAVASFLRFVTA